MVKSDLQHRIALRYKVERLQRAIVASRWLLARRMLAPGLKAVQSELEAGDYDPVMKALDDVWMIFEITESPTDLGTSYSIDAEWYYPMGPQIKKRIKNIILSIKDLRRSLVYLKNQGKPPSRADLTTFDVIVHGAKWLEEIIPKEESGFSHGDFTIVPLRGVKPKDIDDCLAALDKATAFIRPKFPQVLYGKVFLGTSVGRGYNSVAIYVADHDTVSLSTRIGATVGDVHAICHELGHRFFHKFWKDKAQRDEFWHLSVDPLYETIAFDKPTRAKLADEFISNAEKMRANQKAPVSDLLGSWIKELQHRPELRIVRDLGRQFTYEGNDKVREKLWEALAIPSEGTITVKTDKILREPLAVTEYAKRTNWQENFAEAFSYYVRGEPLPAEISAILAKAG